MNNEVSNFDLEKKRKERPIEKIMKEAISMVTEFIISPEFLPSLLVSGLGGCHSVLRRIKEEWVTTRWFLDFDMKCFHTLKVVHRLIPSGWRRRS